MTDQTTDDAAALVGIAQGFARSLGGALANRPDLIEGFLAGRYRFVVTNDHVDILQSTQEIDPLIDLGIAPGDQT